MVRIIIILIAVTAGLGAGWLAWQATLRPAAETVRIEVPSVDVLVSSRDILRGDVVGDVGLAEHVGHVPVGVSTLHLTRAQTGVGVVTIGDVL